MTIFFYTSIFCLLLSSYILIKKNFDEYFIFFSLILTVIAGFRWDVGGDWDTYLMIYERSNYQIINFEWSFLFELINFIFKYFNLGIFSVNIFISLLFFYSLYRISKSLKFDLLLVLIVAFSLIYFNGIMGYVRQTLALSFFIISLEFYFKNKTIHSIILFIFALLTHISVIIFMPIFLYKLKNNKIFTFIFISTIIYFLYAHGVVINTVFEQFIQKSFFSYGAIFRLIPLLLCNLILILFHKKILSDEKNINFFLIYTLIISMLMSLILIIAPKFSALIDRLNFYFIIFQIIVIGNLFLKVINKNKNYLHFAIIFSIFYFASLFFWLCFGDYSIFYLNYNFFY